jgi:hypothetical protein
MQSAVSEEKALFIPSAESLSIDQLLTVLYYALLEEENLLDNTSSDQLRLIFNNI